MCKAECSRCGRVMELMASGRCNVCESEFDMHYQYNRGPAGDIGWPEDDLPIERPAVNPRILKVHRVKP